MKQLTIVLGLLIVFTLVVTAQKKGKGHENSNGVGHTDHGNGNGYGHTEYPSGLTTAGDSLVWGIRNYYDRLNHSKMKTDYLFNRGFITGNSLEDWYQGAPVINDFELWEAIYAAIQESFIKKRPNSIENIEYPTLDEIYHYSTLNFDESSTIAMGVIDYKGDYVRVKEGDSTILNQGKNPDYKQIHLFAASVTDQENFYNGTLNYRYTPDLYFSNYDINNNQLHINFDDGNGFVEVFDLTQEQLLSVTYSSVGEKNLQFQLITETDTLYSYSKVNIVSLKLVGISGRIEATVPLYFDTLTIISSGLDTLSSFLNTPTANSNLRKKTPQKRHGITDPFTTNPWPEGLHPGNPPGTPITITDPFPTNPGVSGKTVNGSWYLLSSDNVIDKPILIIEGFDLGNSFSDVQLMTGWEKTGVVSALMAQGYDIFTLNLTQNNQDLRDNYVVVAEMIKNINSMKAGNHENVVIT